jgi:FkbM family methyltransferase
MYLGPITFSITIINKTNYPSMDSLSKNNGKRIIYDIGANNGDDIPYYLEKADLVIAVEANPKLCKRIREKFKSQILNRKLIVCNCVLLKEEHSENVPFYINKENDVLSQFQRPKSGSHMFKRVELPARSVGHLFSEYGFPYYVKIDIEHYDHILLRSMFEQGISPSYLSVEAHNIDVFLLLSSLGGYDSFKLVKGSNVSKSYKNYSFQSKNNEEVTYSFPHHSAGPFGEDVIGQWVDLEKLFRLMKKHGLGWIDIHAKTKSAGYLQLEWNLSQLSKYWYYWFRWQPYRIRILVQNFFCKLIASLSRVLLRKDDA